MRTKQPILFRQVNRFIMVGVLSTFLNYSVFYLLLFWFSYLFASSAGYITGVCLGYFLNKGWTFEVFDTGHVVTVKYFLIYLFSLILGLLILYFLVDLMKMNPKFANIFNIFFTTISNFLGLKFLVFKK